MPVWPARAVLPMRWVYEVGEVGRSKLSTQETRLKSMPRDIPYSLFFLMGFLFWGNGGSVWSFPDVAGSDRPLSKLEGSASLRFLPSEPTSTLSLDESWICDSKFWLDGRGSAGSPNASCSSDAIMIS